LSDFCIDHGAIVPGIAQLLFEQYRRGEMLLPVYLRLGGFGDISSSAHAHAIREEAKRAEKQNARCVEHPDMSPGGVGCERQDAMGEIRYPIPISGFSGWMLRFLCKAVKQCLFRLVLLFGGPILSGLCAFSFFASGDGGNYIADYRFVLSKGFAAGRTDGNMLLEPSLLVIGEVARGRSSAEL
jgi:hypothetical protein